MMVEGWPPKDLEAQRVKTGAQENEHSGASFGFTPLRRKRDLPIPLNHPHKAPLI